jgi:hypothetical protein
MTRRWGVLVLATAGLACQDSQDADPIAVEDFCPALAVEICDGIEMCCDPMRPMGAASRVGTQCLAREAAFCRDYLLSADDLSGAPANQGTVNRVVIEFDEEGAGRAVSAVRLAAASCAEVSYPRFADVHALHTEGELCADDEDCLAQLQCVQKGAAFGTCARAQREGQACVGRCEPGLLCISDGEGGGVCSAPRRIGMSCASLFECEQGSYCAGTVVTGSQARGVCVAQARSGQPCTSNVQCLSLSCGEQTVCIDPEDDDGASTWCVSTAASATDSL